jgi:hypothetical protein
MVPQSSCSDPIPCEENTLGMSASSVLLGHACDTVHGKRCREVAQAGALHKVDPRP